MKPACKTPIRQSESGYSLMEVLIAVAIIAVLAALIAPRLFGQLDDSKITAASTQIRMIETSLDTFRLDLGRYPTQEEGLGALLAPTPETITNWNGPYLDGNIPVDPWGRAYGYFPNEDLGRRGIVYTFGADGTRGGSGPAQDITSVSANGIVPDAAN